MAFFKKRPVKGGFIYRYTAKLPVRLPSGEVVYRWCERSTGTCSLSEARTVGQRIEAEAHERAGRPVQEDVATRTFAHAAAAYMENGEDGRKRFMVPIIERIGALPLEDVTQEAVQAVARELVPSGNSSTINRQVFTPVLAVLNFAHKCRWCPPPALIRPSGHDKAKPLRLPEDEWFEAVLPHLSPKMRACMLLITLHGLRISEAINRTPGDLNARRWTLSVPTTKNEEPAEIPLSQPVIEAIKAIPHWRDQRWLFGTRHRSNVYRALRKACAAAGVPYYSTHPIGRHSFSTRWLRDGKSLKALMEAGRWKTAKMPMQRYGHLESSEVTRDVNDLADRWSSGLGKAPVVRLKEV